MKHFCNVSKCALVAGAALLILIGTAFAQTSNERGCGWVRAAISACAIGEHRGSAVAGFEARAARGTQPFAQGCAQCADHLARRRRLRSGLHVRRGDQHANAQQARRPGHQLQHLPHDIDLLADPRGVADGAQSPARRQRHDRRARGGLGRLYRRDSENICHDGRGLARLRLQDGGNRQVAQHARRSNHLDGSVRSLADRAWLRLFLRLYCRRDVAMGAAAGRKHQPDRTSARRKIPPERRPRADMASIGCGDHRRSRPTSRSSCTGRPAPATGRTRSSRNGPTSTKASSTTAGMPIASACLHDRSSWAGSRRTPSSRRAPARCLAGTAFPKRSAHSSGG